MSGQPPRHHRWKPKGERLDAGFLVSRPANFIALTGGAGLVPLSPGTAGSIVGLPLGIPLQGAPLWLVLVLAVVVGALGVWACGEAARAAGVEDHGAIVFDEAWAMALVAALSPPGWVWWLIGLAAFRLFDVAKPWPARRIDRDLGGGFGIMADDGVAALYTLAFVHVLARVLPL